MSIAGLDKTDNEIIELLTENSRMSYSDIGEKLGLSRTAIKNRMDAMERKGVIEGYTLKVSHNASPSSVEFYIEIEAQPRIYEYVLAVLVQQDYIKKIADISGECRIMATGIAPDMKALNDMNKDLRRIFNGIRRYKLEIVSSVIQDSDAGIKYKGPSQAECVKNIKKAIKDFE